MNTALNLATFIVAFVLSFYAYRRGLKDGLSIKEGAKTIESIKTPVSTFKEYVEQRKEAKVKDDFIESAMSILTYDEDKVQKEDK
jgi:type III secretory pathway component EscR